jgi:hypothetical protein
MNTKIGKRRESHRLLSYASVVSTLALVIAVGGGTAWAAQHYLITSTKQIKPSVLASLHGAKGAKGAKGTDGVSAAPGAIGPTGATGSRGATGSTGAPGATILGGSIPSGTTVTGAWGGRYIAPQLAGNNSYLISYSLPVKAPAPLLDVNVNAAPNAAAGDPDASCTGSVDAPTAPAGTVCLYIGSSNNAQVTGFSLISPGSGTTRAGDDYGFIVRILDTGTVGDTATTSAEGTWAYTAP